MGPRVSGKTPSSPGLHDNRRRQSYHGLTTPLVATAVTVALIAILQWPRRWLYSGCAIQSLITLYGESNDTRILSSIPLWTLLATLNLVYAICSTSWLLYLAFTVVCYVFILITCLFQFSAVAGFARRVLRRLLRQLHFTKDKIALFNLPALEIDTDVSGLFVIRGVTLSLSSLTIIVHGIELGIVFPDDLEVAIYVDDVTIALFRRIQVGEVYANIKGGKVEMSFADLAEAQEAATANEDVFERTPLLKAATAGSKGFNDRRPMLHKTLTGSSFMRDSSPRASLGSVTTLSPDDTNAEKRYRELVNGIKKTSAIYQSQGRVKTQAKGPNSLSLDDKNDLRAAVCTDLHDLPAIPHPPTRSKVFKHYSTANADIRRLENRLSEWLDNANFGVQLGTIDARAEIPLSTAFDIMTSLKVKDIIVYRTVLETGTIAKVARLGGADATLTIPSYLLPHHEHIVPPPPTAQDEEELTISVEDADSKPKEVQAEEHREQVLNDEANITMSLHVSLPAVFDQSLLDFIAALVKATKIIGMVDEGASSSEDDEDDGVADAEPTGYDTPITASPPATPTSPSKKSAMTGLKSMSKNIKTSFRHTTTTLADLHTSNRESFKKAMVSGLVNDRWIAKVVGKVAAKLEEGKGDVGWTGSLPVPLVGYREGGEEGGDWGTKLLP